MPRKNICYFDYIYLRGRTYIGVFIDKKFPFGI